MGVATTPKALAKDLGKSVDKLYRWANRKNDPLPIRYVVEEDGTPERYGAILNREFEEWFIKNSVLMNERNGNG